MGDGGGGGLNYHSTTIDKLGKERMRDRKGESERKSECCIFRPAFGCSALQMLVEIVIFSIFCAKNIKSKKFAVNFCKKKVFFKFAPKRWSTVIFPKNSFFSQKPTFTYNNY